MLFKNEHTSCVLKDSFPLLFPYLYYYYEQHVNRELKRIHISGYRCNERLKAKTDGSKRLAWIFFFRARGEQTARWETVVMPAKPTKCAKGSVREDEAGKRPR